MCLKTHAHIKVNTSMIVRRFPCHFCCKRSLRMKNFTERKELENREMVGLEMAPW